MIPASYLFKQVYRQHWEEPDAPTAVERNHRFIDGLVKPLAAAVSALLRRPTDRMVISPATQGDRDPGPAR